MHLTATSHTPTTGPRFFIQFKQANRISGGAFTSVSRFDYCWYWWGKKTRSPDCARRHLDSQNTTHSNNYNTIYWLLKRTKSNRLYLYLMSCLCVAPLPLRKNCRATAWRMIVFTKVHRLGCLLRERISLATLSFYNVISKSLHTRTFCPWRKQKKNLLLSIWPLTPTRASGLFSSPFDCACALVETIFPLGVSHSLSERTC